MFKNFIIASASLLMASGILTSTAAWNTQQQEAKSISTAQKTQSVGNTFNHTVNSTQQSLQDSPQQILNKIKHDHMYVPNGTNPDATSPQTLAAIKTALQNANQALTKTDMQHIKIFSNPGTNLSEENYTIVTCYAIVGSAFMAKNIFVEIAKNVSKTINLYNPLFGVNKYNSESSYLDDIFLKGLNYNASAKTVTFNRAKLTGQDLVDYENQMAPTHNINPGLVLLNRYLHNGFLAYNPQGYIPPRQALLSDSSSSLQTVISVSNTCQKQINARSSLSDWIKLDMHWDRVNITLGYKLMNPIVHALSKSVIAKVLAAAGVASSFFANLIDAIHTSVELSEMDIAFDLIAIISEATEEFPYLSLIMDAITAVIDVIAMSAIIDSLIDMIKQTFEIIFNVSDNPLVENLTAQQYSIVWYSLTFSIHFFELWKSTISETTTKNPNLTFPSTLTPSLFNPSLGVTSFISGNENDFTIVASSDQLSQLCWAINPSRGNDTRELFKLMEWGNYDNFKNLKVSDLYHLGTSVSWALQIPEYHMAVIHVKKINQKYQIVWTNLDNSKGKTSLKGAGLELDTSFIGENIQNNILINESIYQKIITRYLWCKNNWNVIKNSAMSHNYLTWQAYFENYVIAQNGINQDNVSMANLEALLNTLTSYFGNLVKMSHSAEASSQLYSIYFNQQTNNLNIQTN